MLAQEKWAADIIIAVGLCRRVFRSINFLRKVFPKWLVLWNDNLAEAEGISAEARHSLRNQSVRWPSCRSASCVGVVLLWPDFEWEESGGLQSGAEQEEVRVEAAEKEFVGSDGEMVSGMIPFRSQSGLWDTRSTISLRSCNKIRGTRKADFFISLEGSVCPASCLQSSFFLIN